ncbi:hypothetical protein D9M73_282830 [compost metagenome]
MIQALLTNYIAHTNEIDIFCRNLDGQITLGNLKLEIHLLFALDGAHLDLFDHCCTVVRVDNCLANLKNHVDKPLSHYPVYHDCWAN